MNEPQIYKPPGCITLDDPAFNYQMRLGLQGPSGSGKTVASATFPYPTFVSYDRGLVSQMGRSDIIEAKFYDEKFVDLIHKRDGTTCPVNRKEALIDWLVGSLNPYCGQALKLTKYQTLVLDAQTGIQSEYHKWWEQNKEGYTTRDGKIDTWKEWRLKIGYFTEIMMALKSLQCGVIYISHEAPDRKEDGTLNGQVRPLITGQFQDELQTHFTDWFRSRVAPKPKVGDEDSYKKFKDFWQIDDPTAREWIASTPKEHASIYIWQTVSDNVCACKTSLFNAPKYILAHYNSILKYQRKAPTNVQLSNQPNK